MELQLIPVRELLKGDNSGIAVSDVKIKLGENMLTALLLMRLHSTNVAAGALCNRD